MKWTTSSRSLTARPAAGRLVPAMESAKAARPAGRARGQGVDVREGSVRQAREEAGLSLAKLAGTDVTRGAIFLIETGRSRPSMATLRLIADRTGRPLS